jgi:hypothetical protein
LDQNCEYPLLVVFDYFFDVDVVGCTTAVVAVAAAAVERPYAPVGNSFDMVMTMADVAVAVVVGLVAFAFSCAWVAVVVAFAWAVVAVVGVLELALASAFAWVAVVGVLASALAVEVPRRQTRLESKWTFSERFRFRRQLLQLPQH